MKKFDWKALAELIGIAAIVASLIFVGLQMKQSRDIAIAEQYQARTDSSIVYMLWLAENGDMKQAQIDRAKSFYEAGGGDAVFNEAFEAHGPEFLYTKNIADRSVLIVWDNYYKQYQLGTMDEESWIAFRHRLKKHFRDGYARSLFTDEPERFRESFRELCTDIIAEIENETVPAE